MLEVRERKWSCLHLEKKVLSVLPMTYMLYIKVCAKKVYKQEKRKNNKKREVYLMWRVLSCILVFSCVQFFCWCCHCLSSALWYWHGTSIDFLILCHCWKQCFVSFGYDMTSEWCSLVYLHKWQYLAALQSGSLVCDTWWRQKLVFSSVGSCILFLGLC